MGITCIKSERRVNFTPTVIIGSVVITSSEKRGQFIAGKKKAGGTAVSLSKLEANFAYRSLHSRIWSRHCDYCRSVVVSKGFAGAGRGLTRVQLR